MNLKDWHIYIGEVPYSTEKNFWVSFESTPTHKKTNANIYGRCLPCIQNLYYQLQDRREEINLGTAYNCWKICAILHGIDECISLLYEFENRFPLGHVYGKFGSGSSNLDTSVVVFHTENITERDRIRKALDECIKVVKLDGIVTISRACNILYNDIFGDWKNWKPIMSIMYPENVEPVLKRIKKILETSQM